MNPGSARPDGRGRPAEPGPAGGGGGGGGGGGKNHWVSPARQRPSFYSLPAVGNHPDACISSNSRQARKRPADRHGQTPGRWKRLRNPGDAAMSGTLAGIAVSTRVPPAPVEATARLTADTASEGVPARRTRVARCSGRTCPPRLLPAPAFPGSVRTAPRSGPRRRGGSPRPPGSSAGRASSSCRRRWPPRTPPRRRAAAPAPAPRGPPGRP